MLELVKAGGWLMLPIILCSVISISIIVERFWSLQREVNVEWLLNYRGGSFLIESTARNSQEARIRGIAVDVVSDGAVAAIYRQGQLVVPDGDTVIEEDVMGGWSGPFFMAPINTRNIHRSNALMGHRYGEDFHTSVAPVLEALEEHVVLLRLLSERTSEEAITVRIGTENEDLVFGFELLAIFKFNFNLIRILDNMVVGHNIPVFIDDKAFRDSGCLIEAF